MARNWRRARRRSRAAHTPAAAPTLRIVVNGHPVEGPARPGTTVAEFLRDHGHVEVKVGCGRGECGACTVLIGGRAVHACTTLAALVSDQVQTAVGVAQETEAFRAALGALGGFQCGFCTPGQVVSAAALLRERSGQPRDDASIRRGLNGNVCRCTGYQPIVDAVGLADEGSA